MRTLLQDRHKAHGGLARKDQGVNRMRHLGAALAFAAIWGSGAAEVAADAFPDAAAWRGVEFVSAAGKPTGACDSSAFRSRVVNAAEVESAWWFTTGLGVYQAYVNGKGVSGFLKPGFTHYAKCRAATASDVTALFDRAAGATNELAAVVSAGWWRDMCFGMRGQRGAFAGLLRIRYRDGRTVEIPTRAADWQAGFLGKVRRATIFNGEVYDDREPMPWEATDGWSPATANAEFAGEIRPMAGGVVNLRRDLTLRPVEAYVWKGTEGESAESFGRVRIVRKPAPGEAITLEKGETLVVDFGQNCAAVPEFAFAAERGVRARIVFGEMMNDAEGEKGRGGDGPSGSVMIHNLRDALARVDYTFRGGEARYLTEHSYFGYRYLSMTATGRVTVKSVVSIPVTSICAEQEGNSLETGVPALNRLASCVLWGARSNYLSTSTDCPQRNERQGWTGDAQTFVPASLYAADVAPFLSKFCADIRDSQWADGAFPSVAPPGCGGNEERGVTGWADAGILIPYRLWLFTGDARHVRDNWSAMVRYMDWLDANDGPVPRYGDWLTLEKRGDDAYRRLIDLAYWIWDARCMAEMARAAGFAPDAARFAALEEKLADDFRKRFFDEKGELKEAWRTQCGAAFSLALDLCPTRDSQNKTARFLTDDIRRNGNHLKTGFLGTAVLLDGLSKAGCASVAYDLVLQREMPSWLYNVDQGATTIWERWDSYSKKDGFGGGLKSGSMGSMNSFNHYSFGSVYSWLFQEMAGIRPDPSAPGFKRIVLSPNFDRRIGWVKARYASPHGVITSEWRYDEKGELRWTFTVPEGTTAFVKYDWRTLDVGPGTYALPEK